MLGQQKKQSGRKWFSVDNHKNLPGSSDKNIFYISSKVIRNECYSMQRQVSFLSKGTLYKYGYFMRNFL